MSYDLRCPLKAKNLTLLFHHHTFPPPHSHPTVSQVSPVLAKNSVIMSSQFFSTKTHILPGQHVRQYSRATAHSQDDVLRVALKQYLPLNYDPRPGDVTIIAVPSNGFPKEMYEPLWDDLLVYSRNKFRIRGIWMMDLVNQNESGELNRGQLGNERKCSPKIRKQKRN